MFFALEPSSSANVRHAIEYAMMPRAMAKAANRVRVHNEVKDSLEQFVGQRHHQAAVAALEETVGCPANAPQPMRAKNFSSSIMVRILRTQIPIRGPGESPDSWAPGLIRQRWLWNARRSFPARFPRSERDRIDRSCRFSAFYCDGRTRKNGTPRENVTNSSQSFFRMASPPKMFWRRLRRMDGRLPRKCVNNSFWPREVRFLWR